MAAFNVNKIQKLQYILFCHKQNRLGYNREKDVERKKNQVQVTMVVEIYIIAVNTR